MSDCRPMSTPIDVSSKSESFLENSETAKDVSYRHAVGSIMYLMIGTRPDLAFAIRKLSQSLESPLHHHCIVVKRVLRYISSTRDHGILFQKDKNLKVLACCDSDCEGCCETRKFTSAFVFMLAEGAISWRSSTQTIVALSACEAQYIAASLACIEAIWLSRLFTDMLSHDESRCIELRNSTTLMLLRQRRML